jgi:dipeptidyl aminopeptidase/acylaminoacyl peptidase
LNFSNGKFSFQEIHPGTRVNFILSIFKKELEETYNNNPWLSETKLAKQEKIVYDARDGLDIEAVLIYPLKL